MILQLTKRLFAAVLTFAAIGSAQASTVLASEAHVLTGANSYGLTYFSVTTAGTFDVYTMGPTIDPYIELFTNNGLFTGANRLGSADDNCPNAICGPAGSFANGIITLALAVGDYVAVVTDCCQSMVNSPNYNRGSRVDTVSIVIASDNGTIRSSVPEPATLALVGVSLMGLGFARRRRTAIAA